MNTTDNEELTRSKSFETYFRVCLRWIDFIILKSSDSGEKLANDSREKWFEFKCDQCEQAFDLSLDVIVSNINILAVTEIEKAHSICYFNHQIHSSK